MLPALNGLLHRFSPASLLARYNPTYAPELYHLQDVCARGVFFVPTTNARTMLLYTGSSFSLWKVTKIIFLFHQNYFSRKKFCGYRFRLHVLLLKLSTVSINSLLRRVEFIDFCGWFLHASFLSDHFF